MDKDLQLINDRLNELCTSTGTVSSDSSLNYIQCEIMFLILKELRKK